jgi:protein TonB
LIVWGFAVSLALHLTAGPLFANFKTPRSEDEDVQQVSMTKRATVVIHTPPPTPAPTPPPKTETPAKRQPAAAPEALRLNVVRVRAHSASGPAEQTYVPPAAGSQNGVPGGLGSGDSNVPPAAPTPSPEPACETPHVQAALEKMAEIEYPESQREAGITGVVDVEVALSADGAITGVSIYRSSGHLPLDQAALRVAQESTYAPEELDCKDVPGTYLLHVTFGSS